MVKNYIFCRLTNEKKVKKNCLLESAKEEIKISKLDSNPLAWNT